jgi:hypothetical protein
VPGKHLPIPPEVKKEEEEFTSFMLDPQTVDESFDSSFEQVISDESELEEPDESMPSQKTKSINPFQSEASVNHNISASTNPFLQDNQDNSEEQEKTGTSYPEPVSVSAFDFESILKII